MLKLYYAPHTCALASHIALEEVGAKYETVRLNLYVFGQPPASFPRPMEVVGEAFEFLP